jgi:alpha-L-rhamnosidase
MNYAGKGFAPANKSCDASWASAFPTAVYATMKTEGDISIARRNYVGLKRFIDNEIHRATQNASLGLRNMFTEFGDWISQPGVLPGGTDPGAGGVQLSSFSFVKDLGHFVKIAEALGRDTDAAHYRTQLQRFQKEWHDLYFSNGTYIKGYNKGTYNTTTGVFTPGAAAGPGGQPSNSVGVWLDGAPAGAREAALRALVADVLEHKNHTSCGIISWRYQLEALSKHGYTDLAFALLTQKTYPSLGFEILNPLEPATTWWEQWDALPSSGGMNSRNHIMFAGPLGWMYTYGAGLQQAPDSLGFEHVVFAPPGRIIAMAVNNVSLDGNVSAPLRFATASKTTPRGTVGIRWYLPPPPPPHGSCFADVPAASGKDCGPGGCTPTARLAVPEPPAQPNPGV